MEQKGCELIGCYTTFVTVKFDLNHDLDLGFSRSNTVYSPYIAVVYIAESDISRSHVGPHFLATHHTNFVDMVPKSVIFREIAVIPWTPFAGDSFSRNLLTAVAFDPARKRQFSAKSALGQSGLPVNTGGNTCCAMASHRRRIIDTSIVSQSRVLLIRCPCKSVPQTANQGKTNAFLIKSSLTC